MTRCGGPDHATAPAATIGGHAGYGATLATPGVAPLIGICLLARVPITSAPIVLTLYVVVSMHRGFAEAGAVAAAIAVGTGLGSPAIGHALDTAPLRVVLAVTTVGSTLYWIVAGHLTYVALLVASLGFGLVAIPVFTMARQSLTAVLPPPRQLSGISLDAMSVEISYAIGPALGVLALTRLGAQVTFVAIAATLAASGAALIVLNPLVHSPGRGPTGFTNRTPLQVRAVVLATLLATFGATFILTGTETALTAAMRELHAIGLLSVVILCWCLSSLAGGYVFGRRPRRATPWLLLAAMAALTAPIGLASSWWLLALLLIPSGILNAPVISATAQHVATLASPLRRGRALGLHTSALTFGDALGAPIAGLLIDGHGYAYSLLGLASCGLVLAAAATVLALRKARPLA